LNGRWRFARKETIIKFALSCGSRLDLSESRQVRVRLKPSAQSLGLPASQLMGQGSMHRQQFGLSPSKIKTAVVVEQRQQFKA
jgi:hypothetical protein